MGGAQKLLTAAVAAISLIFAAPAFAVDSSVEGYSPDDSAVVQDLSPAEAGVAEEEASAGDAGGLPFTGRDAGLIAGAGAMLALLGLGLRRLTTASPSRAA